MESRKTLSLSKTLSPDTLIKIKLKRSPEEQQKKRAFDQKTRAKRIKSAINWLIRRYPDCFNKLDPKPLKLHIERDILRDIQDLVDDELKSKPSKNSIQDALRYYTHSQKYLEGYLKQTYRIDLNGQPLSEFPITEQQKEYAQKRLQKNK